MSVEAGIAQQVDDIWASLEPCFKAVAADVGSLGGRATVARHGGRSMVLCGVASLAPLPANLRERGTALELVATVLLVDGRIKMAIGVTNAEGGAIIDGPDCELLPAAETLELSRCVSQWMTNAADFVSRVARPEIAIRVGSWRQ